MGVYGRRGTPKAKGAPKGKGIRVYELRGTLKEYEHHGVMVKCKGKGTPKGKGIRV